MYVGMCVRACVCVCVCVCLPLGLNHYHYVLDTETMYILPLMSFCPVLVGYQDDSAVEEGQVAHC